MHARSVGVENAGNFDSQPMLAIIVEKKCLRTAFTFVVAGPVADGVHVAPVGLGLGMDRGIAVDFTGRRLKNLGLGPFGQPQDIDRPMHAGFGGLHRVELVMDGRGRTGQVIDLVDLDIERKGDVMPEQLEIGPFQQVADILLGSGKKVIQAEDIVLVVYQAVAKMGTQKAGSAGNQNPFLKMLHGCPLTCVRSLPESIGVVFMPVPGGFDNRPEVGVLRLPAQFPAGKRTGTYQPGGIPGPARTDPGRDGLPGDAAGRVQHLFHRIAAAVPQVVFMG